MNIDTETIFINIQKDKIGPITIEDIIIFESTPEAIFGHVSRVSLVEEKIFILDNRRRETLFLFNSKGQLLNKTMTGEGPGECSKPLDYYINQDSNTILLFDQILQRFITYDLDLNYKSSKSSSKIMFFSWFTRFDKDKWLVHQHNRLDESDTDLFSYLIYSSNFEQIEHSLLPEPIINLEKVSMYNPISRESIDRQLLCRPFDQTLYAYEDNNIKGKYYLDFGALNLKQKDKEKGYKYVYSLMRKGEVVILLGDLMNSDRYMAVSFVFMQRPQYLIYSKDLRQATCSIPSTNLPYGTLKGMANDSTFILMVEPHTFLEFAKDNGLESSKYEGVRDGGNDVMVLFSLQE